MASALIRQSGHREREIGIVFSGLRPGEKLYEELLADADQTLPSGHPRLRIASLQAQEGTSWLDALREWLRLDGEGAHPVEVRGRLREFVPEYEPGASGAGRT